MPPQRVLLMVDRLGRGGAAQVVVDLALGLDRDRFEPWVCTTRTAPSLGQTTLLRSAGVPLLELDRAGRFSIGAWRPLWRVLPRVSIIHSHESGSNFWARIFGKAFRVPIVITHDHTAATEKGAVKGMSDRLLGGWSDRIITVSEFDRDQALDVEGLRPEAVKAVYNGIDAAAFRKPMTQREARERADLPRTGRLIAVIARLVPQKNHMGFLEAVAALPPSLRHDLNCVLVGDGYLEKPLRSRAEALGIGDQISFLGIRDDVDTLLRAADMMVLPSNWECLPITVLEALASGCPIVATAVGGVPEVLGRVGWPLVEPGDPQALRKAIEEVFYMPDDERRARAEAGTRLVEERFSRERLVAGVEAVYDNALRELAATGRKV